MPYIKQEKRGSLDPLIEDLSKEITCEGDLNYIMTSLIHKEVLKKGKNYQVLNNLIGALECAKIELYRTVIGPYEALKLTENGNVSELDKE